MSNSIRLSPKHGVNPSISICFWCGQEKNELCLLGRLAGDAEAPKCAVFNYEPCENCKAAMAQGFTVIEATQKPNSRATVPMQDGAYPTGKFVVITQDAARRIFPGVNTSIGKAFLVDDLFEKIFGKQFL